MKAPKLYEVTVNHDDDITQLIDTVNESLYENGFKTLSPMAQIRLATDHQKAVREGKLEFKLVLATSPQHKIRIAYPTRG